MRIRFIFASSITYIEAYGIAFYKCDDTEIACVYKDSKDEEPLICVFDNEGQKNAIEQARCESIEVNETQKNFEVHYKHDDSPKPVEKLYTFEDIKKAWLGFKKHEGGPWEGNFLDFLYGGYADDPISDDKVTYTLDKLKTLWQAYMWQFSHDLPDFRIKDFVEFIGKAKGIVYSSEGLIDHIVYKDEPDDTYKKANLS